MPKVVVVGGATPVVVAQTSKLRTKLSMSHTHLVHAWLQQPCLLFSSACSQVVAAPLTPDPGLSHNGFAQQHRNINTNAHMWSTGQHTASLGIVTARLCRAARDHAEHQRLACLFKWRIWASTIYRSEHREPQLLQVHITVSSVWSHDILLENKGASQGEERQMALMATWNCEKCFSQSRTFILRGQHKTLCAELLWPKPMKLTFPTRIPLQRPLLIQLGVSNNVTAFLLDPRKQNYERSSGG